VWANCAASGLLEVLDGFQVERTARLRMHVEDEDLAALQAGQPKLAPVVGEAAVVRFVPSADRVGVDDFAVTGRTGFDIHGDQFVRAVAQTFDAERPDVNEFLLPFDAGQVGRGAGFIGVSREQGCRDAREGNSGGDEPGG
jgi:hypothetical protein